MFQKICGGFFCRKTYSRQAQVRALGIGPYNREEKRDKRTCWRKKRLGGTFPGKRNSFCSFISATMFLLNYKLILLPAFALPFTSTTPRLILRFRLHRVPS